MLAVKYLLILYIVLATEPRQPAVLDPYDTQNECQEAGHDWVKGELAARMQRDINGSVWFACTEVTGGHLPSAKRPGN